MTRPRGGYIGFNRVPAAAAVNSAASGIWTLREAEALKRAGTWPLVAPGGVGSGLQLWLDASDASTLYDATTGGSLVAADGGVARWEDKSGNSRHMTQSTSGSRPTRKAAIKNNLDVVRFDGSADFMSVASSTATFKFLHDGDATVLAVYKWAAPAGTPNRRFLFSNHINSESVSGTTGSALWMRNDFGNATPYSKVQFLATNNGSTRTNSYTDDNSFPADTFHVLSLVADNANATNASRAVFRKNGSVQADTAAGDNAALPTADASYDLHICTQAGPDGRYYAQCDMCEMILYDSALSDTDRSAVESYLIAKWGIT